MSELERRRSKKKTRGSQEIRQSIDLAKAVAVGVVVLVIVLAVGNYSLSMMKNTGVGNSTIYNQGQNMLNTISSGFGNVVNIIVLVLVIIALGVVIATVERW
jgi:ABC-type anion transport system duplicated permease subunit